MSSLLNFLGMIIVALIGLVGIVIQNRSHTKLMKQDELIETIDGKIDLLRTECKNDDIAINRKMDNARKNSLKRFLVTELTKIKHGEYIDFITFYFNRSKHKV